MRKFLIFATSAIAVAIFATPNAFAHRDAAAKARGDMSSFWSSHRARTRSIPSVSVGSTVSDRSFSYVPAPQSAEATQKPADEVQVPAQPAPAPVVQESKSFSYQPAPVRSQSYRPLKRQPWQFPKTDPRRYRQ